LQANAENLNPNKKSTSKEAIRLDLHVHVHSPLIMNYNFSL